MRRRYLAAILALALLSLTVAKVVAIDSLQLTMRGDWMAPAIKDGDTVIVKVCTNGSLIKAGAQTSPTPGDIIVYCAGAVVFPPPSFFTCGRAISKRFDGGHWFFRTKMDNITEPDSWEVPDHALIGIVVNVYHTSSSWSTPSTNGYSTSSADNGLRLQNISTFAIDFTLGIMLGLIFGVAAKKGLSKSKALGFKSPYFSVDSSTASIGRGSAVARGAFRHPLEVICQREHP